MSKNKIIPYNPKLKEFARQLRKNSTLSEILLWKRIKNRAFGVQFHRQVPLLEYIVDFYCHEIQLAIEIDGVSHDYRYEQDIKRQGDLEKRGVSFIRFTDSEVNNDMFGVLLALGEKIGSLDPDKPKKKPLSPPSKGDFKFPKNEKLKSRKLIGQLFDGGRGLTQYPLKLIYLKHDKTAECDLQAAFAVPKKNIKRAVGRNRVKRLMREAYRLNKAVIFNNMEGKYALMILYLGGEPPLFDEIDRKMKALLGKFLKAISDEKNQ